MRDRDDRVHSVMVHCSHSGDFRATVAAVKFALLRFKAKAGSKAGGKRDIMAKFFAVTIIVIAIASAIPILRHTWPAPQDISVHGHLIDEQMSETMAEAGISFLAAQFILAIFIWKFSNRPKDAKIGKFPGGAKGLVIAAFLLVGTEVLALGIFGTRAWASVYFTPPAADAMPIQVQAGQFAFYFRYPGPDGKFGPLHPSLINEVEREFFWP